MAYPGGSMRRRYSDDRSKWNEDDEANLAASMAVAIFSGVLKYGMYLTFPLHVAMLVVGFAHRHQCPVNVRIPWYLMFGGAAGIMTVILRVLMVVAWACIRNKNKRVKYDPTQHPAMAMVRAVMYLFRMFVVAWNIAATFHIYKSTPDFEDENSPMYCHKDTYYLAYVLVILFDLSFAVIIIIWTSALVAGMLYPEMVDGLYEDADADEVASIGSVLSDLEGESNSLMEKQRQRRRKRKQKQRLKVEKAKAEMFAEQLAEDAEKEKYRNHHRFILSAVPTPLQRIEPTKKKSSSKKANGAPETSTPSSDATKKASNAAMLLSPIQEANPRPSGLLHIPLNELQLPVFGDGPAGHRRPDDSESDISSNEDRNILNSVRFSRLVDSRRISKDYYSRLQQQEASSSPTRTEPGARRLKDLFAKTEGMTDFNEKDEESHNR